MAINKVVYGGDTLVDLTSDTVTPETLAKGYTAHGADGEPIVGTMEAGGGGGSEEEWIGDGNTHIWISLAEGRTSPMLGVCPNGTVTVDWGDGTTPDVLTGTSLRTAVWTPTHNYAAAGDYVITLTVNGTMTFYGQMSPGSGLLRYSSAQDDRNKAYQCAVKRVEVGSNITSLGDHAFNRLNNLLSVYIPDSVTSCGTGAFYHCYSLSRLQLPNKLSSLSASMCYYCYSLSSVQIPNSVNSAGSYPFYNCYSLASVKIPANLTSIASETFRNCYGLAKLRFDSTTPPSVSNSNAFTGIPTDCVISVPVGSLAAYTSATNYPSSATYTYIEED